MFYVNAWEAVNTDSQNQGLWESLLNIFTCYINRISLGEMAIGNQRIQT